jgi:hypothetical protein
MSPTPPPVPVRAYAALVALYPRRFRDEYGADLVSLFRDQCRDEATWRVVGRAAIDLILTVPHQHLEARMHRNPTPTLTIAYAAASVAGLGLAAVGGSAIGVVAFGLAIALVFGALAATTWRRAAPAMERATTSGWWKFVLAGPALIAAVVVAGGLGVEAWEVGIVTAFFGVVLFVVGVILGIAHATGRAGRRPAAA